MMVVGRKEANKSKWRTRSSGRLSGFISKQERVRKRIIKYRRGSIGDGASSSDGDQRYDIDVHDVFALAVDLFVLVSMTSRITCKRILPVSMQQGCSPASTVFRFLSHDSQ